MPLYRLIYASTQSKKLQYSDLKQIMLSSEQNNQAAGITGILCLGNGRFLQLLEGPRSEVSSCYSRIVQDDRHTDLELIDFQAVTARISQSWSMRLVSWDGDDVPAEVKPLLLKYSSRGIFDPNGMTTEQALGFLSELME